MWALGSVPFGICVREVDCITRINRQIPQFFSSYHINLWIYSHIDCSVTNLQNLSVILSLDTYQVTNQVKILNEFDLNRMSRVAHHIQVHTELFLLDCKVTVTLDIARVKIWSRRILYQKNHIFPVIRIKVLALHAMRQKS